MELTLSLLSGDRVSVTYEEQVSHTFDLSALPPLPAKGKPPAKPAVYGAKLYELLFPDRSLAARMLASEMKRPLEQRRFVLVAVSGSLESVLWEFLSSPQSYLTAEMAFVRALPLNERKDGPLLSELRVSAVQPGASTLQALQSALADALTLAQPSALEEMRKALGNAGVLHFEGTTAPVDGQVGLLLDKAAKALKARDLKQRLGDGLFLAALSAGAAPTTAPTEMVSMAAGLMHQGAPYTLALRYNLPEAEQAAFWGAFYTALAGGKALEDALAQARRQMGATQPVWFGAAVLFTSLKTAAASFGVAQPSPVETPAAQPAPVETAPAAAPVTKAPPVEAAAPQAAPPSEPQAAPEAGSGREAHMSGDQIRSLVFNTVAVMTTMREKHTEWRAAVNNVYRQAKQMGHLEEIEFLGAVLSVLDGVEPMMPADNPYQSAMQALREGIEMGGPKPVELSPEVTEAVRALLQAADLNEMQLVVQQHQAHLFTPEADELLAGIAADADQRGNKQMVQSITLYAAILQECQKRGIEPVFAELMRAQKNAPAEGEAEGEESAFEAQPEPVRSVPVMSDQPIPDDFVARCAAGLKGGRAEREGLYAYLESLPIVNEGVAALLKALKLALLGSNLDKLGAGLSGEYAELWQQIVKQVKG